VSSAEHPFFAPLQIRGETYDLAHLNEMRLTVNSQKAGRDLTLYVRFTTHCFSEMFNSAVHPEDEPRIRDEGNRWRAFCPVRFGLSKGLPNIIRGLNHPKVMVKKTASGRNWLHSTTVQSSKGPYHVFFEIRRPPVERRDRQDVELIVESAYPQDPARKLPLVVGPMGFLVVVGNVFLGRPVKTRR
jgi:hypothetical protein